MPYSRKLATFASGILGFVFPMYFALTIYQQGIPQNIATWVMIVLLNAIGLVLVLRNGNEKPYMQLGWFVSSVCVLAVIAFSGNPWHWQMVESVSLALCLVSLVLWKILSARAGLIAYMVAFYSAVIPMVVDLWHAPDPRTTWLWLATIGTCLLSIYGAERRDLGHTIVPWGAVLSNMFLAVLSVR